jgi:putative aminopeptidase FrvX
MPSSNYDHLFNTIEELVLHHSPSGAEREIDQLLISRLQGLGVESWQDRAGNIIAKIPGQTSERFHCHYRP